MWTEWGYAETILRNETTSVYLIALSHIVLFDHYLMQPKHLWFMDVLYMYLLGLRYGTSRKSGTSTVSQYGQSQCRIPDSPIMFTDKKIDCSG